MNPDEPFRTICIAGAFLIVPFMLYHRLRAHVPGEKLDRWQEGKLILFTLRPVALAFGAMFIGFMISPPSVRWAALPVAAWVRWIGVGMAVSAGLVLAWAVPALGRNLTDTVVTRAAATLVTSGPYRWVRHPFYVAVALAVLGNSLAAANWFMLVTGTGVIGLLALRTPREEARLIEKFGDAYRAYARHTGRFLPRRRDRS